ncbi:MULTISPECIES: acyl-CoA dehydrogenase family protein [Burkholderia]|uniref:acyl-CoA dehydrogenase family protein n=1 Tax=Burkholderia TaxID=32008 RepID=UPI0006905CA7|nr:MULTISPECIES: acyl-CoA dehydrogenase family protein [Burkholderia]KWZ47139.1 acyl-CoA dehydrogenase [Burkholderia savannae]
MGTSHANRMTRIALDPALTDWLDAHAASLDASSEAKQQLVPRLAAAGAFHAGLPVRDGEAGDVVEAVATIAALARHSLTAAFVCWAQRTFVEYLLHSPNAELRARWLPALLSGDAAGATGLSNAMKYLQGIESLQLDATPDPSCSEAWRLNGALPWVTNVRPGGALVAVAVAHEGRAASIFAVRDDAAGVARSDDLDLIALRGSNTAALRFTDVALDARWRIHDDAHAFLPAVRPAFLGMQCAMAIGLASRSLDEAGRSADATRRILDAEIAGASDALDATAGRLVAGLRDGAFGAQRARLFEIRIALAELVQTAVQLELQASGGRAYVRRDGADNGFERRWREAAFVPVVTPSLVQLKSELAKHAARDAA